MQLKVTGVYAEADDQLRVVGVDVDEVAPVDDNGDPVADWTPSEYVVYGWVSATTRFYDPADVDASRLPVRDAKTRSMTPAEVGAYALALLEGRDYFADVYGATGATVAADAQPVSIPFT